MNKPKKMICVNGPRDGQEIVIRGPADIPPDYQLVVPGVSKGEKIYMLLHKASTLPGDGWDSVVMRLWRKHRSNLDSGLTRRRNRK